MTIRKIIQDVSVEVLTLDGFAGTGKGTIREELARNLNFHSLDSGVLYRALGFVCNRKGITDVKGMVDQARNLDLQMAGSSVILGGVDQTKVIRSDECGNLASIVAKVAEVRQALLGFQLGMRKPPGLVTDGRDQGFIFKTPYRYFFTASAEVRAERRVLQFKAASMPADYGKILDEIKRRDESDLTREVDPLRPHPEALCIDTTELTVSQVTGAVLEDYVSRRAK